MSVWKESCGVASEGMVFADQVSQCAEEGAGLGWFECHCWFGDFVVIESEDALVAQGD